MQKESQWHNDKGQAKSSLEKICTSHFIVRVRKGYSRFYGERELKTEQNCNILTPTLMAINIVSFSFSWCSTRGPGAQLSAECWLSLPHLISNGSPKLLGAPRAPSARVAFPTTSYQQLLWIPTHQGLQGPFRPGVAFPTTSRLSLRLTSCLDWVIS